MVNRELKNKMFQQFLSTVFFNNIIRILKTKPGTTRQAICNNMHVIPPYSSVHILSGNWKIMWQMNYRGQWVKENQQNGEWGWWYWPRKQGSKVEVNYMMIDNPSKFTKQTRHLNKYQDCFKFHPNHNWKKNLESTLFMYFFGNALMTSLHGIFITKGITL